MVSKGKFKNLKKLYPFSHGSNYKWRYQEVDLVAKINTIPKEKLIGIGEILHGIIRSL